MSASNSTGLRESGYKPITLKKPRVYTKPKKDIPWDDYEIGHKAKMLQHVAAERMVGADVMEHERKFGFLSSEVALDMCVKYVPDFIEWFVKHSGGLNPLDKPPKGIHRIGAVRLRDRLCNAYHNPEGKKEDGTKASRSREHYMHPSKGFLRKWAVWAEECYQDHMGFKVRSQAPRNETQKKTVVDLSPKQKHPKARSSKLPAKTVHTSKVSFEELFPPEAEKLVAKRKVPVKRKIVVEQKTSVVLEETLEEKVEKLLDDYYAHS